MNALYGFRAEHSRFPKALAELVPAWLPAVPQDPRNPAYKLEYQPVGSDFLLYARALNGEAQEGRGVPIAEAKADDTEQDVVLHSPTPP